LSGDVTLQEKISENNLQETLQEKISENNLQETLQEKISESANASRKNLLKIIINLLKSRHLRQCFP